MCIRDSPVNAEQATDLRVTQITARTHDVHVGDELLGPVRDLQPLEELVLLSLIHI